MRPYNRYSSRFNGDGRTTVRPYNRYTFRLNGDGRTTVRPYNRYTSRRLGTDAPTVCVRPCVPTTVSRLAVLQRVTRSSGLDVICRLAGTEWCVRKATYYSRLAGDFSVLEDGAHADVSWSPPRCA